MLYHFREWQQAMLQPLAATAKAFSQLTAAAPFPFARSVSAGFSLMHRLNKTYEKPAFGLTSTEVDGQVVDVVESVERTLPFCRLLKFNRALPAGRAPDPVVLIFAPLSGHHATLLRATVRTLLPDHEVYITDWVDARLVPVSAGRFGLDGYIATAIEFMRLLGPQTHVMAVCQPAVPVLAAVSLLSSWGDPNVPRTLTVMGGPVDPRLNPTAVNRLAMERDSSWFRDTLVTQVPQPHAGAGRRVYPGFLQHLAFMSMNPDRHAESHWSYVLDLMKGDHESAAAHTTFYDEYNAVLDLDADFYLDTVRLIFQDFALPRGVLDVTLDGQTHRVVPADVRRTALLTVEGELDDITGLGQTQAAQTLCANVPRRQHYVAAGAGHYGLFSGRRWREDIAPVVRAFIRADAR